MCVAVCGSAAVAFVYWSLGARNVVLFMLAPVARGSSRLDAARNQFAPACLRGAARADSVAEV
jgi:hypothetical protein